MPALQLSLVAMAGLWFQGVMMTLEGEQLACESVSSGFLPRRVAAVAGVLF